MTLPLVVEMTVDTGNIYELSAETNQHEINLDNELEINVVGYDVPEYEGSYTVNAGLSPVVLNTQDKRLTQNVTVNALTENRIADNTLTINQSNGRVSSSFQITPGYNDTYLMGNKNLNLPTEAGKTVTPTTSEQYAVYAHTYTLGDIKVGAIPSQYADITGVTANASDVLAGKYFVNNLGELTLGTAIAGGGDGAPMPVDTVAEMIDTTKVYLYVGSETGYTFGNWYYYNGTAWVSGGKWGADGGVNTNARNLLQYILERVAYTETDMEPYVTALYEALAQAGAVTTTYTITNALSHITNSNTATGCEAGDSYTGTLTADTNYAIDTVTVTMGGVDITSTAYSNGVITIASVTGDIVITANAKAVKYSYVYTNGDLIKVNGALSWTSEGGAYIDYNTGTAKRRGFVVNTGVRPFKEKVNDTTYIETDYYPIPIPADATSVTISITPTTQYHGEGFLILSNGEYTRTLDPGWKQGSFTHTFTAGTYEYLSINCKYNQAGSTYPTEPSEMTVTFNR